MNAPEYSRAESAPYPTSDAVSRAGESVAALRAGVVAPPPYEAVGRGLLFSLLAVPVGLAAAALLDPWGVAVAGLAIGAGAAWLYARGAGNPPRAGVLPLAGVIVLGVVLSFLLALAAGLGWSAPPSRLLDPQALGSQATDLVVGGLLAALGAVGAVRHLRAHGA